MAKARMRRADRDRERIKALERQVSEMKAFITKLVKSGYYGRDEHAEARALLARIDGGK